MCSDNTSNYSSFEDFIKGLDNNNEIKKYIYSNRSTSDFEKNVFINQLKDAFCQYNKDENDKNKKWFKNRLEYIRNFNDIQNDDQVRNYMSTIGELQIYGLLMRSLFKFRLEHKEVEDDIKTPDFIYIDDKNRQVNIEIATFLGTNKEEKLITNHTDGSKDIYPFSKPQKINENDLSGLISMLNNIKQKDEQFNEKDINILVMNLVSPLYKNLQFNFFEERYKPYYIYKCPDNAICSGGVWQAFYSKKGDNIFYSIGVTDKIEQEVYKMPYNSRFNKYPDEKYSIVDFAILNTYETTAIYQNLNRRQKIHKNIYRCLMSLNNIKLDSLWLNFPINNLEERVNYYRELGEAYLREAEESKSYI